MNKLELRKKIINTCISILEQNVQSVRDTIEEIIQTASEYEGDHDMFDPFRDNILKKKDLQLQQLEKYLDDIKLLNKIDSSKSPETVKFGAIVITDKQKMIVSTAIGKVQIDNDIYFAISTQVPVYKAMQGLKTGETFSINNNQFTIKDIF